MQFGSLFSGIGGMDLGLERSGMQCVWQVEIDEYAKKVLEKHWPKVRRHDDVRTFPPEPATDWAVDIIAGGFPCQPVSHAGLRKGQNDERWLWPEFFRAIRLLQPRFIIIENVPGLLVCGFHSVLADLASIGFDAEWSIVSACSMGAAHMRKRLFVVAYPNGSLGQKRIWIRQLAETRTQQAVDDLTTRVLRLESAHRNTGAPHGVRKRMDRAIRAIGNAVVPQVAQWIGERIMESADV